MEHPSHDNRKRKERKKKECATAIKLHLYLYIPNCLSLHTHTPLSLSLPHKVSLGEGLNEALSFLLSLFLLRFQFCVALISFSFYCWSRHSCERLQHTREHAYKHTRCSLNEILQCCYLSEIKRATSSSLVITPMHTDNIRWSIVRGPACIVLLLWRDFANTYQISTKLT